jgi:predicted AAA+ superfamily ATPase
MTTYTNRQVEGNCRRALDEGKILVLIGARQTGKSTLARELLRQVPEHEKLFLNLDDPFLRDRLVQTEGSLIRAIEEKAGRPWSAVERFNLVIDEAQKAPALFEIIKALFDAEARRLRIVLTGSSALAIHNPVAETLAGRARIQTVLPFSLAEGFANANGSDTGDEELPEIISRLLRGQLSTKDFNRLVERARWNAAARRQWVENHIRFPLFPEPASDSEPEMWLRDYLATYLEKDVQSLTAIGNVALFRSCIRQVAARTGTTMKWETAAQEVGTTSVTLRKYIGLMEQTFNLIRLAPFTANPVKRVIKAPKLYLVDCGLLWALRGFEDHTLLEASGMLGAYMELAAVVEIAKWCALEPTAPGLRFWSKTAVSEVDIVVSNRGFHIPFEIKLSRTYSRRWLRGLDAFEADHRALSLTIPYRIIIHLGEPERPDERTFVLPLWLLA